MQRYHAAHNCSWPMLDGEFVLHSDAQAEIARLTAERDQALARAAAAAMEMRDRAAKRIESLGFSAGFIHSLTIDPDAQKALDKMLAKVRKDAIREAADLCKSPFVGRCWEDCHDAILALLTDGGRDE